MRKYAVSLLLVLEIILSPLATARQEVQVCGTYRERAQEALQYHQKAERHRQRQGGGKVSTLGVAAAGPAATRAAGNLVVMSDANGVVSRFNAWDLEVSTLRFLPSEAQATKYKFEKGLLSYDQAQAQGGLPLSGLGDDDFRQVNLPFAFPFYGQTYRSVFVNSDGNLTFNESDTATSARSLGRFSAGPPRIAPLFADLDPSRAPDSVRVLSSASVFVVSWSSVPEFSDTVFFPTRLTFQARLYPDGKLEFAYTATLPTGAVVGIAPGGLSAPTVVVTFTEGSSQEFTGGVAERFTNTTEVDIVAAAQRFYSANDDAYDYLVFFNTMGIGASPGAIAYEVTVRSFGRQGLGDPPVDYGATLGSPARLQAIMNMGPLSQYPGVPNAPMPLRPVDTPLTVLAHEAGHLFLAFASVRDPQNPAAFPMLGRQLAHWSFLFNSEASLLEGTRLRDNGAAAPALSRFETIAAVEGYSPLDQYLMGFVPPNEVPPSFYVTNPSPRTVTASRTPQVGVVFGGERRDVTVQDVIAAEGKRIPDHTVAQRRFRFAFIVITEGGKDPSAQELEILETFRTEFEKAYGKYTSGRGVAEATLKRSLHLSAFPAAGLVRGQPGTATLTIAAPARADLNILLRANSEGGSLALPAGATIKAGERSVTFPITGERAGVAEILAEPADAAFAMAFAKMVVRENANEVKLTVESGDRQPATPGQPLPKPVVVKVTDENLALYPGVTVRATPSAGGSVNPAVATTDASGQASFTWTPAATAENTLRFTVEGGTAAPVSVTATNLPALTAAGVVNAASFAAPIARGSLASIFGTNLSGGVRQSATSLPLPTEMAGVRVVLGGVAQQLIFVSDRQINFYVAESFAAGEAELFVMTPVGQSTRVRVLISERSPGIFYNTATREGAVLASGTGQLTSQRPAGANEVLEVYATGLGGVRGSVQYPGLFETVAPVRASINGAPANVLFAGLAPGFVGLYQVNVQVPGGIAAGQRDLILVMDGANPSNAVLVSVR